MFLLTINYIGYLSLIESNMASVHTFAATSLIYMMTLDTALLSIGLKCILLREVYAMALCLSVRLSVCLSVTRRCSIKTTKDIVTQTIPHGSLGEISMGSSPTGAPNTCGVGKICGFRQINRFVSKTVQERRVVSTKCE